MNDNYTSQDEYDPMWDEPTLEVPVAAVEFQLMLDERVRNLTKDMRIETKYSQFDVLRVCYPHLKE